MWNFLFLQQISSSAQSIWLCGVAYFEHICLSALFIWLSGVADFPQICFSTLNIWIFDYLAVLISQTDLVICTKYTIVRSCLFLQQIWLAAPSIWLSGVVYFKQIICTWYMIIPSCLSSTNLFIFASIWQCWAVYVASRFDYLHSVFDYRELFISSRLDYLHK